ESFLTLPDQARDRLGVAFQAFPLGRRALLGLELELSGFRRALHFDSQNLRLPLLVLPIEYSPGGTHDHDDQNNRQSDHRLLRSTLRSDLGLLQTFEMRLHP